MRKKDYELIGRGVCLAMVNGIITDKQMFRVADTLADQFQQADPRFNRDKFLTACGIDTVEMAAPLNKVVGNKPEPESGVGDYQVFSNR